MNKGLWFRDWENSQYEDDDGENEWFRVELSPKRFGTLFLLEDEFITDINSFDNNGL